MKVALNALKSAQQQMGCRTELTNVERSQWDLYQAGIEEIMHVSEVIKDLIRITEGWDDGKRKD